MQRVLCIVSGMERGGAETFLMKIYRKLDKEKYQFDFCVSKNKKCYYDDEILTMGGKIFYIPPKSKNPFKSFINIIKLVKKEKYQIVLRTSQQSLATLDLVAAKIGGAKKLIYRSSNAGMTGNKIKKIANSLFSFLPRVVPDVKIAPSTEAAEYVFGKKQVDSGKVIILPNGLDYNKFKFNRKIRNKIRNDLNIDNKIVIGHVGRFNVQKNHKFLINVFNEIHKKNKDTVLLLIGEGELEEEIKTMVKKLKLNNCVKFLGAKSNVNEYLMAMDILIFPSYFEGMPNVVIEAQAAGLKCFISDAITKEANITGLVKYLSLEDSISIWTNEVLDSINYERENQKNKFSSSGYLISNVVNEFIKVIF